MADRMRIVDGIPPDIAAELGQIISLWPQVENLLRNILANAAGTTIKVARVLFREPGAETFANTLRDVLIAEETVLEGDGLDTFSKTLRDARERRDVLAHSIWGYDESEILGVQRTRGTWNLGHLQRKPPRIARKAHPDFLTIDLSYLQETKATVLECIRQAKQLDETVAHIRLALLQKFLAQACPKNPPQDQDEGTPQPQHQSSPA